MRIVTFLRDSPLGVLTRLGAVVDDGARVVDLNLAAGAYLERRHGGSRCRSIADAVVPADTVAFLEVGPLARRLAEAAVDAVLHDGLEHDPSGVPLTVPFSGLRLQAPLQPRSLRELSAYGAHLRAVGMDPPEVWYERPLYWKGNPSSTIGPDEDVHWPGYTGAMDFELEIAAVIGVPTRDVAAPDALDSIAGFTIFNDVSARDVQRRENQFLLGPSKGKDFCNVLGPVLVTPDEIDVDRLDVEVRVNGEVWARATTEGMQHGWADTIAYMSQAETLLPGDVITSGTIPGCCALERFPGRDLGEGLLAGGDVVELEVRGIGVLRNRFGVPPSDILKV